jgi:hypothetical protein
MIELINWNHVIWKNFQFRIKQAAGIFRCSTYKYEW